MSSYERKFDKLVVFDCTDPNFYKGRTAALFDSESAGGSKPWFFQLRCAGGWLRGTQLRAAWRWLRPYVAVVHGQSRTWAELGSSLRPELHVKFYERRWNGGYVYEHENVCIERRWRWSPVHTEPFE